jgi:hypothetical protein
LDSSDFVNQLIRQEFAGQTPPPPPAPAPAMPPPPLPATAAPRMRIVMAAPVATPPAAATESKLCSKHHERATEKCSVCHQPICPKCLELFGYFCSPLCKGKAEAQHLNVPVYAGRHDVVEAKYWRKMGWVAAGFVAAIILFLGLWTWFAWFGSVPHPYLSVRFEDGDRGYSGSVHLAGQDQVVFLHGGTLARYDLKSKQKVWSHELITKSQIEATLKAASEMDARLNSGNGYKAHVSQDDLERGIKQALQSELTLRVSGQNIWVGQAGKLTRYNWDTGEVVREIALPELDGELTEAGDEMQMIGSQSVTHISLATGETRTEQLGPPGAKTVMLAQNNTGGGLPGTIADKGGAMDPGTVEAQAANLKLPGLIALPALLSNARHEQQLEQALRDDPDLPHTKGKGVPAGAELFQLVPGETGFVQFGSRLLEERIVSRSAMKAPPKKSVLDGDLNAAKTTEVANEIVNEMQRNAGGGQVTENQSRYQVTVHLPNAAGTPDWTGEVVGAPQLYVLKTVNVVAAGRSVVVLDKSNQKMWGAALTYPVTTGSLESFSRASSPYGEGPCVEHGGALYVFDQAVLSSFELASGNVRWRLPSVGVVGLFFDAQNNVYINTTTGNPDDIKYSRQIDFSRRKEAVFSKVDAQTGKTLWSAKPGGFVSYVSGKFIYAIESFDPNPTDADILDDTISSLQKPAYLRIARLRPSDGKMMWEYYDRDRCPVYWHFDDNSIELIFKREVQVLRYLTF